LGATPSQLSGKDPGKLSPDRWTHLCQVILFANVRWEVVKFDPLIEMMVDQLPVTPSQRAEGPLTVVEMGEMKEEGPRGERTGLSS
jgi:hypothetical protein